MIHYLINKSDMIYVRENSDVFENRFLLKKIKNEVSNISYNLIYFVKMKFFERSVPTNQLPIE